MIKKISFSPRVVIDKRLPIDSLTQSSPFRGLEQE